MDRRAFFGQMTLFSWGCMTWAGGCRGHQYAHILNPHDRDMVGSHTAGAETWEPLIQESTAKLLGRQHLEGVQPVAGSGHGFPRKRICFGGVDNRSAEELGDFRDQIYQKVDNCLNESQEFEVINRRYVEAGLRQCGLRPEDLFVPAKRRQFLLVMEQQQQPVDYLLFATITSGTTQNNGKNYQRDYLFTLELVDMETGHADKEATELRKGYHKTKLGSIKQYGHK